MRLTREFKQDIEDYITEKPNTVIGKLKTYTLDDIFEYIFVTTLTKKRGRTGESQEITPNLQQEITLYFGHQSPR